jgi:hypothetical protein
MRIKLEAWPRWAVIDPDDVNLQVDPMVLDAIWSAIPREIVSTLLF